MHSSFGQGSKMLPEPFRALCAILHVNINDVDPVNGAGRHSDPIPFPRDPAARKRAFMPIPILWSLISATSKHPHLVKPVIHVMFTHTL
jgi:hypothetical protein